MTPSLHRRVVLQVLMALLVATLALPPTSAPAAAQAQPGDDAPPPLAGQAVSLLPPGNSGFVSLDGQVAGMAGGSYGDNIDDQSDLYWGMEGYAGQGFADPADAVRSESPRPGVRIYWDRFGVPAVYGDTGEDVWFGAGYAVAQIRLFLMDAVRRMGRGTFAALAGSPGVPADVQVRTLAYSEAEYQAMYEALTPLARDAVDGYVDGANAWIEEVAADPSLLPAEYVVLTTTPEPLDAIDILAAGVFITRFVASEGGQEMDNVAALRQLEDDLGVEAGRGVFTDLVWNEDPEAITTVPREEGVFENQPLSSGDRSPEAQDAAFSAMADWASSLPLELADGQGTGAHPEPTSLDTPDIGLPLEVPGVPAEQGVPDEQGVSREMIAGVVESLETFRASLGGGSIAVAIGPDRTADGQALLLSGPQLGYTYPSLLVELEVHGGGYHARGSSVPALPTVGIGYTDRVAWALTTGYSKTIDSFIETVRGTGMDLEYLHDGEWTPADCRAETVDFRESSQGAPISPALRSETVTVCRTVHGPIVSVQAGEGERLARSVQYQMFGREIDTVEGVLRWNRASTLEEFEAAMRMVTWNENTTYADADGHIAYWHPGLHRQRPVDGDLRLPLPGDGSMDLGALLPFEALPQTTDPTQGYLANWNNKPAFGWFDGIGIGPTSRPGGAVQRVSAAIELVEQTDQHTFETMQALEQEAGLRDPRATPFLPLILSALSGATSDDLGGIEPAALTDLLTSWNRRHHDPAGAPEVFSGPGGGSVDDTDAPAATVFDAIVAAVLDELLGDLPGELIARQTGVGSHVYDASPAHNLALRVLDPATSGLTPSRDYTGGRTTDEVVLAAVEAAVSQLVATYGSTDLSAFRRPTARSEVGNLTGLIGPSASQPYQDRGSYVHVVGFDPLGPVPVERADGADRIATALSASELAFPDGASTAVLAAAGSFPDALTAAPLAGVLDAPVLLVGRSLDAAVRDEVGRLGVSEVVIVGGSSAVPASVADELSSAGLTVRRLAGSSRFATAAVVAQAIDEAAAVGAAGVGPTGPDAYVVSGSSFADALSVGAVAARTRTPILLVERDAVPPETAGALDALSVASTVVVGGPAVVSDAVLVSLPSPSRVAGADRYATAAAVLGHARSLGLGFDVVVLATGADFPDGLSGGAVAAALDGLVVLVDGSASPAVAAAGPAMDVAAAQRASIGRVVVMGGVAAVPDGVAGRLSG